MNNQKIFITTTLPYVGTPHVGHLFEFVLGDILARWYRINNDVRFNVGADENGSKVLKMSKEANVPLDIFLDNNYEVWLKFCEIFHISYDNFYRTSSKEHYDNVSKIWIDDYKRGDIYKKNYTSKYCIGCESFKLDKDLVDGKCNDHINLDLETITEENYFFNLGKYKEYIINWLSTNPITPSFVQNELYSIINDYEELSISRLKTENTLGVTVPNDENQIIYIWKDALANYTIAAKEYWDEGIIIQLCGRDNTRFQGHILQTFLAASGKKHTDKLLVHGTILDSNGSKMSKTVGNVVNPIEQYEKNGADAIRYYCAYNFENFNWDENILKSLFNNHIVNGFGNLVSRVLHLIDINEIDVTTYYKSNHPFILELKGLRDIVITQYNNNDIKLAVENIYKMVNLANQYINNTKPWSKEYGYEENLVVLYVAVEVINDLYSPIFPETCKDISESIKNKKKIIAFTRLNN